MKIILKTFLCSVAVLFFFACKKTSNSPTNAIVGTWIGKYTLQRGKEPDVDMVWVIDKVVTSRGITEGHMFAYDSTNQIAGAKIKGEGIILFSLPDNENKFQFAPIFPGRFQINFIDTARIDGKRIDGTALYPYIPPGPLGPGKFYMIKQ